MFRKIKEWIQARKAFTAVDKGDYQKIAQLLSSNHLLVRKRNRNGESLLHRAARNGYSHLVIKNLLARGADPNARDDKGNTPLHFANKGPIIRYLLAWGANVNACNQEGRTPLPFIVFSLPHCSPIVRQEIERILRSQGATW